LSVGYRKRAVRAVTYIRAGKGHSGFQGGNMQAETLMLEKGSG
jgi:hypothetical protein